MHPIPKHKRFSSRLAVVFAQSIEAKCLVENEDAVGAAPTGGAPTTSEWSTILFPTKVCLILETLRYTPNLVKMCVALMYQRISANLWTDLITEEIKNFQNIFICYHSQDFILFKKWIDTFQKIFLFI